MRPPNPLAAAVDGWILGGEEFVAQCRAWREKTETRDVTVNLQHVLDVVTAAWQTSPQQIVESGRHRNRARDAAIVLARELVPEPLDTLAEFFGGVTRAAITETVRRARQRAEREPAFASMLADIRRELGR